MDLEYRVLRLEQLSRGPPGIAGLIMFMVAIFIVMVGLMAAFEARSLACHSYGRTHNVQVRVEMGGCQVVSVDRPVLFVEKWDIITPPWR